VCHFIRRYALVKRHLRVEPKRLIIFTSGKIKPI
jgi:hypothetical protein